MAMEAAERLITGQELTREEFIELLQAASSSTEICTRLAEEARRLRKQYYGDKVYLRGLIEFTNYCKNNCYYCGIRCENRKIRRYRLTKEEILDCCKTGRALGFQTFVLQGGEDPFFTDERLAELIYSIKERYPECAVTLSLGERSYESYRRLREAGADRYLLRHETADPAHYRKLHPDNMSLQNRKQCLLDLKALGYQVGAGFMVGSPGQTEEELAEDLLFLKDLQPQMVGIGPFIPQKDTPFAKERAGSVEKTLLLLSVVRILLPKALIPATTALGTMDADGREKGMRAGANVVMPNLSPQKNREQYALYDHKISTGEEAAECTDLLMRRMEAAGFHLSWERGDAR